MTDEEPDINIEPTSEELTSAPQTVGSFLISIAFWCTLVLSAMMYATVSLSPKLADWMSVRQQHAANSVRLQELEDEADYLERVAGALKSDPKFAHRLIQATQSGNSQDEFFPASKSLVFGEGKLQTTVPQPLVEPAIADTVKHFASHQRHRMWLLSCAAGLTVLAFTLFNESGAGTIQSVFCSIQQVSRAALARYQRELPEPSDDESKLNES